MTDPGELAVRLVPAQTLARGLYVLTVRVRGLRSGQVGRSDGPLGAAPHDGRLLLLPDVAVREDTAHRLQVHRLLVQLDNKEYT